MSHIIIPGKECPAIACAAYIRDAHGRVLMLLRSNNARNDKGMWGIPGGLIEFGETVEQALVREIQEETSLSTHSPALLTAYTHLIPDSRSHFVSLIFRVDNYTGSPILLEKDKFVDMQWFEPGALPCNTSVVVRDTVHLLR